MSSKEHLSAPEAAAVSSLKEIHHRSGEILRTMARTSALIAALVSPNVFAAPCSAEKEDFINYVTGGNECLALEVLRGEALKKPGSHLVVHVHGDLNLKDRLLSGESTNKRALTDNIPEDSKNFGVIQLIRPGYKTSFDNTTGEYPLYEAGKTMVRYSTGYFQSGVESYTLKNIEAVMNAAARLKKHYESKTLTMTGQSGGAAMIFAGSARFPQHAPDNLILTGTPCNLKQTTAHLKDSPPPSSSISPHDVINQMPKDVNIVAFNGVSDEKTPPSQMQECVNILEKNGVNVTFIQPFSNHNSTARTPEYGAALMAVLESEPRAIVAQKKPSASPALIPTSLSVPAK